ncbi:MAG: type II toxin-antitoxin system Phd/YefM family antitoxin [Ardenticatenaceae bacterium]
MSIQTTYAHAHANLATLLNEVTDKRETIIINRPDAEDVALIAANELSGLIETIHLLRSPKNAERLLRTLNNALARIGKTEQRRWVPSGYARDCPYI